MKNRFKNNTRSIVLICDTCGEDNFITLSENFYECNTCKRKYTKEELIELNQENIDVNIREVKAEITDQISKEFKKVFKKWK
ncbi:hypothetical protein C6378_03745 [Acinetobacter pittii]|uniref:ECs_2282 family putative zinc-binding protein n=1 Tax=Acinetobacter pittii TaxID=48296 RepID=UPI001374331C|nr:hypothetical protein [Acinetobacter pittii]MDC4558744.1 hypothetical protein [Acinetobacter baumannii]MBQ5174504.1 hypothetical protein [Acinetobacter pittii]QHQ33092.1 hypothetical protein EPY81_17685 [Acinetobacter pittii]USQ62776.1 hypothetical protein C7A15_19000 [Acinetobacter pittii]UTD33393.1 hypothetical protein DDE02_05955 [Acinetobacter pittii]